MSKLKQQLVQYIGFIKNADGRLIDLKHSPKQFTLLSEENDTEEIGTSTKTEKRDSSKESTETDDIDLTYTFRVILSSFEATISAYRPLITHTENMFSAFYSQAVLQKMHDTAKEKFVLLEEDKFEQIYGIPINEYPSVKYELKKVTEFKSAFRVIPSSTLLSLVATFDSFLSEVLTTMLRYRPELISESESKISFKELMRMGSFPEAQEHIISQKIDKLMRGSHKDQITFMDANFHTDAKSYDKITQFYEIFERRNLAAHGSCIINETYISNSKELGFYSDNLKVGDELEITEEYLSLSANTVTEFGILLIFTLWKKNCKKDIQLIYDHLAELCYGFIKLEIYSLAADLLNHCLITKTKDVSDISIKRMTINLANCYKKLGLTDKCKETLTGIDWSATTEDFQICVCALNADLSKLFELMDLNYRSNRIKKNDFREWPVFDWVNEENDFLQKYEALYGEAYTSEIAGEIE